jgi:hypothetical protein
MERDIKYTAEGRPEGDPLANGFNLKNFDANIEDLNATA